MSVTLKTNQVKLKIQNGNYQAPVVIADQTTADHVAEVNTAITTTGNQQVSAIQTKGDEVLDSIPEDYTDLVEEVDELKSAIGIDMVSVIDTTKYTSSNAAVVYNNDGTYTIGTTDYGTITFNDGKFVKLEPGEYELFGVSGGNAFVATSNNFSAAIVTNSTNEPIRFTINEAQANYYYIGFYIRPKPSTAFTITPYCKKVVSAVSDNTNRIIKLEELTENTYNLARFDEQVLTTNGFTIKTHADGTVSVNGTSTSGGRAPYLLTLDLEAGNYRMLTVPNPPNIMAYNTTNNTFLSSGTFSLSETTNVGLTFNFTANESYNQQSLIFLTKSDVYVEPIKARTAIDDTARARLTVLESKDDAPYSTENLISVDSKTGSAWTQGACAIGNKSVGFSASADDHSTTGNYFVCDLFDLSTRQTFNHNLGHCVSADYNVKTDVMMVGNGTTDPEVLPVLYLVSDAKNTVESGNDILTTSPNVMSININGIGGYELVCCFGESECFAYAITAAQTGKNFFKLLLGMGENDLTSMYPNDSYGTFISGKNTNEYNGTVHVLKKISATNVTGELQGLKYLNGRIIMPTDEYITGNILTSFISILKMDDDNILIEKNYWIPITNNIGNLVRTECEDVIFSNGVGYVMTRSKINNSNVFMLHRFTL